MKATFELEYPDDLTWVTANFIQMLLCREMAMPIHVREVSENPEPTDALHHLATNIGFCHPLDFVDDHYQCKFCELRWPRADRRRAIAAEKHLSSCAWRCAKEYLAK